MSDTIAAYKNNCTLVAVREVSRLPDEAILKAFRARGYREHCGCHESVYINAARDLGLQISKVDSDQLKIKGRSYWVKSTTIWGEPTEKRNPAQEITIAQFARTFQGVYIVTTNTHALVVRNGLIVDPNYHGRCASRRVRQAFQVHNPAGSGRRLTLRRNEDPYIQFHALPWKARRRSSVAYQRYLNAHRIATCRVDPRILFSALQQKLRDLGHTEPYNRADLVYDIRVGNVTIED